MEWRRSCIPTDEIVEAVRVCLGSHPVLGKDFWGSWDKRLLLVDGAKPPKARNLCFLIK